MREQIHIYDEDGEKIESTPKYNSNIPADDGYIVESALTHIKTIAARKSTSKEVQVILSRRRQKERAHILQR